MKKIMFLLFFISVIILFFFFGSKDGAPKDMLIEKLKNKDVYEHTQNFGSFYNSETHKVELKKFIDVNIQFLSKSKDFDGINGVEGMEFSFYPPKIVNTPILKGVLDYYYVIKENTETNKGEYIIYDSWISRPSKDIYWNLFSMYGYYSIVNDKTDFAIFEKEDFDELNLIYKEKKLLKDIPKSELLKYTSTGYKEIDQKAYNEIEKRAYAIYEFETIRNEFTLKLSFTVAKDKYFSHPRNQEYPYEWSQLFIERID